jgi:hypothetical protein
MAKIKKTLPWVCIAVVVLWSLFGAPDKSLRAQSSSGPDADVIAKLDVVLQNQKAILDNLASIKEELRIIKIRITQQQ